MNLGDYLSLSGQHSLIIPRRREKTDYREPPFEGKRAPIEGDPHLSRLPIRPIYVG